MLKFQCRLVAHWVNLLEELVVFESRKYIRRMAMKVLGSDDAMILIFTMIPYRLLFGNQARGIHANDNLQKYVETEVNVSMQQIRDISDIPDGGVNSQRYRMPHKLSYN